MAGSEHECERRIMNRKPCHFVEVAGLETYFEGHHSGKLHYNFDFDETGHYWAGSTDAAVKMQFLQRRRLVIECMLFALSDIHTWVLI